ncbi:MAG: DUF2125 domain-containing protein [Rhodosalinus sp.]
MRFSSSTAALALAAGALGTPAAADLTAQEVWNDMRSYLSSFGYEVTATDSMSGDTLSVRDMTMRLPLPEDGGTVALELPQISFTENEDGTVSVAYPETSEMRVEARPPDAEAVDMTLAVMHRDLEVLVSGDDSRMTYDYTASELGLSLAELVVEGESLDSDKVSVDVTASGMAGQSVVTPGELRDLEQRVTVAEVSYDVNTPAMEGERGSAAFDGALRALTFEGTARIPQDMDMQDMSAAFAAGYAFDGQIGYTGGNTDFTFEEDGQTVTGSTSSDRSRFRAAMDADRLTYAGSGAGTQINVEGSDLPFPIETAIGETAFDFSAPVGTTEDPEPFNLLVELRDFTMGEQIWAMFDPGQMLPREPASIVMDIAGMARVLGDVFDPQAMQRMAMNEDVPAELHALDLSQFLVSMLGAELTGQGAFTFDNSDRATFDGMPRPEGTLSLRLEGAEALLDTLMQMGLLPQEQAMGARMMMGMFAVPAGPDTLESTIEINEQGQVLANGQRIQ